MKKILILHILLLTLTYSFAQDVRNLEKNNKVGFITSSGHAIGESAYDEIKSIGENCFLVKQNDKWGIIDRNQKVLIPIEYSGFAPYNDYLYLAVKDNKKGLVNKFGTVALPSQYEDITRFTEHLSLVKDNNKIFLIDDLGKTVLSGNYHSIEKLPISDLCQVKVGDKCGIITLSGKTIADPVFDEIDYTDPACMKIKKDGKLGFIINNKVIQPSFDQIIFIQDELGVIVVKKGELKGFVTTSGIVIQPVYENISRFSSRGLAFVEKKGKLMYVNINGKELTLQEATGNIKY